MDLAKISTAFEEGATLELKHPLTNEPLVDDSGNAMTITLAGTDSKRWRRQQDAIGDRLLKTANPRAPKRTMAETREDTASLYASVTLRWHVIVDGKEPECGFEAAKRVYFDYPWIGEQVDAFLSDRANFSTASSRS